MKTAAAGSVMLPGMWRLAELSGEDAAEQLELMRSAFRVIRTYVKSMPVLSAMPSCRPPRLQAHRAGYRRTGAAGPRADLKDAEHTPLYRQSEMYGRQGVE